MKVVINKCYGGFGLSTEAFEWLITNRGWRSSPLKKSARNPVDPTAELWHYRDEKDMVFGKYSFNSFNSYDSDFRSNPDLVACVEILGDKASGNFASLKVVEIPDGVDYTIEEYDGIESIHEVHRSW